MRREAARRRWVFVASALALAAGALAPHRAGSDVKEGDIRTAQAKAGVAMREKPRPLAKLVAMLPYGTRVRVQEVESYYAQVKVEGVGEGWVRAADLVEPTSLTGPGAYGPQGAGQVASADVTAAGRQLVSSGRQFDKKTENTYRRMDESLNAAYPVVDQLEAQ